MTGFDFLSMDYQTIKRQGNITPIKAGRAHYVARIDQVGQLFCRVPHSAVAGKNKFSHMNGYGIADVSKAIPEIMMMELFEQFLDMMTNERVYNSKGRR